MNLRQLRQFVSLAETGSFNRTAEQLHIAQPPLSMSIRKLESELGTALFERTPSGAVLTIAGKAMLADARLVLVHAARCEQTVNDVLKGQGGVLRLGFIGTATQSLLPELIPSLRAAWPQVELQLTEATSSEILEGLVARRFDVGLVRYPVLDHTPVEITPLDQDDFVLAVHAASPLAIEDSIALADAAQQPFIMYARDKVPNLSAMAMMRCQASGFTPRIAQEAMQVQTLLSLVASGLGVALVAGIARDSHHRDVKFLRLTDNPAGMHIGIALARLRGNCDLLVERFAEQARLLVKF